MYCLPFGLKSTILAGAVSAMAITAAHAVEAEDAATRLKSMLALQQVELTYSSATMDGDDVVLADVTVKSTEDPTTIDLGDLTLEKVTEEDDGDYRVERLLIDNILQQSEEVTVEIDSFDIQGLILPRDSESDPFFGTTRYDSLNVRSIEVDLRDQDLLWMENFASTASVTPDGAIDSTAEVESFTLNLLALDDEENDEEFVDTLQEIDYDELSGRMRMGGIWHPADGRLTLSTFEVALDDAGTLNLTADIGGYTAAFARSLAELTLQMNKQGEDPNAQGMAALGLMQQLTFHGLSLRFDDDSFAGRMLNYMADKRGVEPEQLIQETRTKIQAQLSPFTGEAFANSVSEAAGNFLDDPNNIEVAAKPAEPMPFFMLGAALMGAPEALINQLRLTITANQ